MTIKIDLAIHQLLDHSIMLIANLSNFPRNSYLLKTKVLIIGDVKKKALANFRGRYLF